MKLEEAKDSPRGHRRGARTKLNPKFLPPSGTHKKFNLQWFSEEHCPERIKRWRTDSDYTTADSSTVTSSNLSEAARLLRLMTQESNILGPTPQENTNLVGQPRVETVFVVEMVEKG